jgi:hypothetical protein
VQHALELQIGHAIGGGIRYQGVGFGTDTLGDTFGNGFGSADKYQGTMEMFFRLYRDPIFTRVGFMLPLDTPIGTTNDKRNWGVRAQVGFTLD